MTTSRRRVEVHGHRGARGLRPENTLPGFAHAMDIGVDALELDVGLTRDGAVVAAHDRTVCRLTSKDTSPTHPEDELFPYVGRALRDLTLAQVKTLDAGVRRPPEGAGDQLVLTQLPVPGTAPPTLAEVCELVRSRGADDLCLAVEMKTDPRWSDAEVARFVRAVAGVLDSHGLLAGARLLAFDWRVLTVACAEAPAAGRVALAQRPLPGLVTAAKAAGATMLSVEHTLLTAALLAAAHAEGMPVWVWTVNTPAEMQRFIGMGVDAIVTDYPDRLGVVLRRLGLPVPVAYREPELVPVA